MVLVASQRHAGRFPAPCWSRCSALLIASRYRNCYASASASSLHSLIVVLLLHLTCLLMESSTDSLFTPTMLILQRVFPHRSIRMITSSIRRSLSACRARLNDTTGSTGAQRSAGPCSHRFSLASHFQIPRTAARVRTNSAHRLLIPGAFLSYDHYASCAFTYRHVTVISFSLFWTLFLVRLASRPRVVRSHPRDVSALVDRQRPRALPSARLVDTVCGVFGARVRVQSSRRSPISPDLSPATSLYS